MKLRNYVIVIIILTLILASCSSNNDDDSQQETTVKTQSDKTDETKEDEATVETDSTSEVTKAEEPVEVDEADEEIDVSLLDRLLLESVEVNIPDSYEITHDELSMGVTEVGISYKKGLNTREEATAEGVTSITIYNHETRTTYDYILGETTGELMVNSDEENASKESIAKLDGISLMTYIEEEFINADGWSFEAEPIIKASQEQLNGRKTIHVSIIVPSDTGEETEPFMQIWFDKKYSVPLKYIINFGEGMTFEMVFIDADFKPNLDDSLFMPPSDVTFQ